MFDRDWEWSELTGFATREHPGTSLGVVSERRRQGKTFLLQGMDTTHAKPACYSALGFYDDLHAAEQRGEVVLVGLDRLYGGAG